jgi:hypothetical protein
MVRNYADFYEEIVYSAAVVAKRHAPATTSVNTPSFSARTMNDVLGL